MNANMPPEKDERDIEIIPPGAQRKRGDPEWIHVSFEDGAKAFGQLPLHKRILLGATWLAGIVIAIALIGLIVASAVLIWIPLLLATAAIAAVVVMFRTRFRRR